MLIRPCPRAAKNTCLGPARMPLMILDGPSVSGGMVNTEMKMSFMHVVTHKDPPPCISARRSSTASGVTANVPIIA